MYTDTLIHMNTWRGSAIVVVIDAEVVVVEELHRRGVIGATELSPRASIARKAVLERRGLKCSVWGFCLWAQVASNRIDVFS